MRFLVLAVFVGLAALSTAVFAGGSNHHNNYNYGCGSCTDGADGRDGIDGRDGTDGRDGIDGGNDEALVHAIAISGAIANIPSIAHNSRGHSHSNVGFGVAAYDGHFGFAVGLQHQENDNSYKLTIGASHDETIIGAGAGFNF